jgi:Na+/melibiose symporter-like transporter
MLMLSWAVINVMEWFFSLYFQDVQQLSALQTSLSFIPSIMSGLFLNIATGFLAHRFRPDYLVVVTSLIAAVAPLLMALVDPAWPYWYSACWAMF